MTHSQFIRLSGWGMILAALALLLTFVTETQIQRSVQRFFGDLPSQTAVNQVWGMRFLVAILLITLGLLGLRVRYGERAGDTAKLALAAGGVGGVAGVVSNLLWTTGYEHGRALMNFFMAVMFGGLFVFGLIALRARPMPHNNGLPVLASFWWPAIWINASVSQALGYRGPEVPFWASFTMFSLMSFFLAWLGFCLQFDTPPEPALA